MPWCPKCKSEFQDEIKVCPDCQVELVEELETEVEMVSFMQAAEKDVVDKLTRYFDYSELKSSVQFNEETEEYEVFVPIKQQKQAKKLYQAFLYVESENMEKGSKNITSDADGSETDTDTDGESDESLLQEEADIESEDSRQDQEEPDLPEDDAPEYNPTNDAGNYVMKADQYKDLKDTVLIFLLFGIAGLIVVMLNVTGILTFLNGVIPNLVLGGLFLFFIYVGLSTHKKAKQIQTEINAENELTEKINLWLNKNVTESFLSSLNDDKVSDEINYIKKTDTIKSMLIKEFGEQNPAYLDRLIDEFYSSNFEENEK